MYAASMLRPLKFTLTGSLFFAAMSIGCAQRSNVATSPRSAEAERPSTTAPRVALSFDDLPVNGPLVPGETRRSIMARITSTLSRHGISRVTGFVNGANAEHDPGSKAALTDWLRSGNILGNHTYSHPNIADIGVPAFLADVDKNDRFLRGIDPTNRQRTFRFPYLEEGPDLSARHLVGQHLSDLGYRNARVTVDFADWAWAEPYARCLAKGDQQALLALRRSFLENALTYLRWSEAASVQIYGRSLPQVLLLHVSAFGAEMIDDLLTELSEEKVSFVTLDEALLDPAYHEVLDVAPTRGDTLFEQVIDARHVPYPPFPLQAVTLFEGICR